MENDEEMSIGSSEKSSAPANPVDNSDGSSDDSDDESAELELRAEQLERQISNNKLLYDVHVELVKIYEKLQDVNSLREAYKRFYECYPLTPELWLTWIKLEMGIASTPQEKENVLEIFDIAVQDYLSVDLWQEFAQFAIGFLETEKVRAIFERAINAAGMHVSEGYRIWDTYRLMENIHLENSEKGTEEYQKQLDRVYDLFKRQLAVPLIGIESTYEDFTQWLEQLPEDQRKDPKQISWTYKNALKTLETYKPFETRLQTAKGENEIYEIYTEYIKACSDPSMTLCLYERAVAQIPLSLAIWSDYCAYAFKLGDVALNVSKKAVRNCSWEESLWVVRLRILEHQNADAEVLTEFENGISSISPNPGLDLWLAYIEYIRRTAKSPDKLHKLFDQAIEQLDANGDPTSKLSRWKARTLAKAGKMQEARRVWTGILQTNWNNRSASVWLEYARLERQYGEEQQLRKIFERGLNSCKDWPTYIAEEWVMFERECGTLSDMLRCVEKIKKLKIVVPQPTPSTTAEVQNGENTAARKGQKRSATSHDKPKPEESPAKRPKTQVEKKLQVKHDPTKTVFISNLTPYVTESDVKTAFPNATNVDIVTDRHGKSRCFGYVQFETEDEAKTALTRDRELLKNRPMFVSKCKTEKDREEASAQFKYSTQQEPNKLFVRGLPLTYTKDDLSSLFQPHGAKDVRLIVHKSGKPKGLAYVEFEDDKSAAAALRATDGLTIDGHTIAVAVSAPPVKDRNVKEPVRHSRSRLQIPMIPRVVQKKVETGEAQAKKSNEDFRKMFLSK